MRIRTIKPEFWSSETMASLSDAAKLLAIGLLNYCDDEGYFSCNPVLIRSALMPFADDSSIARRLLADLSRIGYIKLGKRSDDGRSVGWVVNFLIHQRIDRPKASEIKGFFTLDDASTTPRRLIDGEGKGMEGNGRGMEGNGTPLPPEGAGAPIPLPPPPEFNPPIPSALDTPAFQDAWRFWLSHLKQKKKITHGQLANFATGQAGKIRPGQSHRNFADVRGKKLARRLRGQTSRPSRSQPGFCT